MTATTAPLSQPEDTNRAHDRARAEIARLIEIMAALRDPQTGCPWDIEQDFATISPYTIEEAHEVADAIARQAWDEFPGELGDLLLQVVFHAQMADEKGMFDFADVAAKISDKLISSASDIGSRWRRLAMT